MQGKAENGFQIDDSLRQFEGFPLSVQSGTRNMDDGRISTMMDNSI